MLRIITDFDGPIMDVSERYYRVYQFCLESIRRAEQPIHILTKAEFWHCKRSQIPEREIGRRSGLDETQALEFARLRKQTVHTLPYLVHDVVVPGAIEGLERIQQAKIELVVMTMRRMQELDAALHQYSLERFFPLRCRYCLSNDYAKTSDVQDKTLLMGQALLELPPVPQTWMIGDTEADILSAQAHGLPVVAVLSGIRDRTQLAQHHPNAIVSHLGAALDYILNHASLTAISS